MEATRVAAPLPNVLLCPHGFAKVGDVGASSTYPGVTRPLAFKAQGQPY